MSSRPSTAIKQQHHKQDGAAGAAQNKGHPAAHAAAAFIADGAEERQQEQSQYIIRRHDDAGIGFIQVEGIGKDLGDHAVIHLPKGADGKERKPYQDGALIIELQVHGQHLLVVKMGCCLYHSVKRGDLQGEISFCAPFVPGEGLLFPQEKQIKDF